MFKAGLTRRNRYWLKAWGVTGLLLTPFLVVLWSLCAAADHIFWSSCWSPVLFFGSNLLILRGSESSIARVQVASTLASALLIVLSQWLVGLDGDGLLMLAIVFILFAYVDGFCRESKLDGSERGARCLRIGWTLMLSAIPALVAPAISVIMFFLGLLAIFFGMVFWALELFESAQASCANPNPGL